MISKVISSADGSLSVRYKDVENVCMTGSIYSLLQYLLLMDEETIKHKTCYMLGNAADKTICSKLPAIHFDGKQTGTIWTPSRWFYKVYLRIIRDRKYPFLKSAKLYGLDSGFLSPLIGKREYPLLSDGPLCMSQNMQIESPEYKKQLKKQHSIAGKLEGLLYGNLSISTFGNNDQCIEFFMTEENNSVAFKDKPVHVKSLQSMWGESSESKRSFIKYVFDITNNDVELLNSKKVLFLTQPMLKDRILTEKEYIDLLKKIFSNYNAPDILLKLHPRDNFNYKQYFPDIAIYGKPVNMQLLVLLGSRVEIASTICSSSINSFPESVEADWFGPNCHPKIKSFFGDTTKPSRPYKQM